MVCGDFMASGNVRTIFIFTDLPIHIEFRAGDFPILDIGVIVEFNATVIDHKDHTKKRRIEGPHRVIRSVLKYETDRPGLSGITQYVEWKSSDS